MTNMDLLEAIGMLSEDIIADADAPVTKRARVLPWRQIGAVAACLCIAIGAFLVPLIARQQGDGPVLDDSHETGAPTTPPDRGDDVVIETTGSTSAVPEEEITDNVPRDTTSVMTTTTPGWTTTRMGETDLPVATEQKPDSICPGVAPERICYMQDFDDLPDTEDQAAIMDLLGMSRDAATGKNAAYSESDVRFAIRDGRLYIDNHDETAVSGRGRNAYFRIAALDNDNMFGYVIGKYTLEYELEYVTAENDAYVALITEYSSDGRCYSLFALRPNGSAIHACHFYNTWKYFTEERADIPANAVTEKLTGIRTDTAQPLANVRMTLRIQRCPEWGYTVYLKTATMTDFVKIAEPAETSDGILYLGWDGWAVALKVGGAVDAYLDHIAIWSGWGERPD